MRKGIIGLSLFLLISLVPAYSATPPKAGSVCSKQGLTKTYQGKKFTCIKSGKKLVWNKGVVIKRTIPTPSPSPSNYPTPTPTPTPPPSSSPTPTISFPVSGGDALLPSSNCRLPDSSRNNFHLGFPITPIIKDLSKIRVFAIPFEFSDSDTYRISKSQNQEMFISVSRYYLQESYGKTQLEFIFPFVKEGSDEIQAISFGSDLKDTPFKIGFRFRDVNITSTVNALLSKTPSSWNLGSYDAVILYSQDSRTSNMFGGTGWRGSENSTISGQTPFDSPSGKVHSLVFAHGSSFIITHELGHSLFGLIDLYDLNDQNDPQSYAQGWGLMASAYSGEMNLRGWERWLAGWLSPEEVRCTKPNSTHYIEFVDSRANSAKLLILPMGNQRAVVVEAIDTNSIAKQNSGNWVFCEVLPGCKGEKNKGLLAYLVDVNKLSGQGPITVPGILKFPNLLSDRKEVVISGVIVKNMGCDTRGCFVSVG